MDFLKSETKINLMRAFAGESQARNRYNMASLQAKSDDLAVAEQLFNYIACQEQAHAKVFYDHLKEANDESIDLSSASYPVNIYSSTQDYLKAAVHNETEEYEDIYRHFSEVASAEGFPVVAASFEMIGKIEKLHAERFDAFARHLAENTLFERAEQTMWLCTNCGHVHTGTSSPKICPVCKHSRGYFLSEDLNK